MPEFGGVRYQDLETKVKGTSHTFERELAYGEKVTIVAEVECSEKGLKDRKDGTVLGQVLKAEHVFILSEEDRAILDRYREPDAIKAAQKADKAKGRTGFHVDDTSHAGVALVIDASGVVMTAAEVAEARGEGWSPEQMVTVVFADGDRCLWPDDWHASGQSLAAPGGEMRKPGGTPGEVFQVRQLVDVDSGVVLSEWTDEQEEARLVALEEQLEAEEAGEVAVVDVPGPDDLEPEPAVEDEDPEADRAARDQLEAGRTPQMPDGTLATTAAAKAVRAWVEEIEDGALVRRVWLAEQRFQRRPMVLKACVARIAALSGRPLGVVAEELEGGPA